jgi:hypothetical protein
MLGVGIVAFAPHRPAANFFPRERGEDHSPLPTGKAIGFAGGDVRVKVVLLEIIAEDTPTEVVPAQQTGLRGVQLRHPG